MDRHSEVQQLKGVGPEAEKDLERSAYPQSKIYGFTSPFVMKISKSDRLKTLNIMNRQPSPVR
ncbi:hypothetical protein JCM19037_3113 [Geomicrobium sp. JCM 19037]|nr:hypothetical protein JCM19037_3113 [Geomicrobium sp. JCM 19037]